jgi:hypothetical protein
MFIVNESQAASIRRAFEEDGELSAIIELRRHFPGIADYENARRCVRTIASWLPPGEERPPLTKPKRRRSS